MLQKGKVQKGITRVTLAVATLLCFAVAITLMSTVSPAQIGPAGVTLWFMLILAGLTGLMMLFLLTRRHDFAAHTSQRSLLQAFRLAIVPAGTVVIMLGLSSLGTLGMSDVVLLLGAMVIIEFYFYSSDRRQHG